MASTTQKNYVIEHMEPEMGNWSTLEYIAIAKETANTGSRFYLTSLQPQLANGLPRNLQAHINEEQLITTTAEVSSLDGLSSDRVCLLDPQANEELSPDDSESFDWFVFGGILGDDPPRDRTAELRKYGYKGRNLGKIQMTTDCPCYQDGDPRQTLTVRTEALQQIPYIDYPELRIDRKETTQMPFRYVKDEAGQPVMPEGMIDLIKADADKSLDDLF